MHHRISWLMLVNGPILLRSLHSERLLEARWSIKRSDHNCGICNIPMKNERVCVMPSKQFDLNGKQIGSDPHSRIYGSKTLLDHEFCGSAISLITDHIFGVSDESNSADTCAQSPLFYSTEEKEDRSLWGIIGCAFGLITGSLWKLAISKWLFLFDWIAGLFSIQLNWNLKIVSDSWDYLQTKCF